VSTFLLSLCFDGTDYHGWQVQDNAVSVQGTLHRALRVLDETAPIPRGCSRTDAGVHARIFCCTVRTERVWETDALVRALNGNLPRSIRVLSAQPVPATFHPQYDCLGKQYAYQIWNGAVENPFLLRYAHWERRALDAEQLSQLAQPLIGAHDFAAFCAAGGETKSTVRTITRADFARRGDLVTFTVAADGFLYNMVRILAGTLLQAHLQPDKVGDIRTILASGKRENAGVTLPPQGLFLEKVCYLQGNYEGGHV
jgi:tRNA pseudouridine38-40 synthase